MATNINITKNICPSLSASDFKIKNKKKFCRSAVKKVTKPSEDGGEDTIYINIKDSDQEDCLKILDMYNLCIDTDNILYPNSKYQRCFNEKNDISSCNINKLVTDSFSQKMVKINLKKNLFIHLVL